jgi:hypothetical protein
MVVTPSPIAADPDVSRGRADWHRFDDWRRHWRRSTNRGSHYHRRWNSDGWNWKWDSKVETEMNSSVCSDCHGRQSQNCDSLFHNITNWTGRRGGTSLQGNYRFVSVDQKILDVEADEIFRKVAVAWALLN